MLLAKLSTGGCCNYQQRNGTRPCVYLYLPSFSSCVLKPGLEVNMLFCLAPEGPWCFIQQFLWTQRGQHSLVPSSPSLPSSDRYVRVSESLLSSLLADTSLHFAHCLVFWCESASCATAFIHQTGRRRRDEHKHRERERQFARSGLSLCICSRFFPECLYLVSLNFRV